ncbi:MAG: hypothetical protein ABSE48_22745 [Verrucomicrobiota bacterium]
MSNETPSSSFPASRQDVTNLKQTALHAADDLSSTVSAHASKARGQLKKLAGHVQKEGGEQLDEVTGKLSDLLDSARDYASERPLVCIGIALAVGFLIGLSRRGSSRE